MACVYLDADENALPVAAEVIEASPAAALAVKKIVEMMDASPDASAAAKTITAVTEAAPHAAAPVKEIGEAPRTTAPSVYAVSDLHTDTKPNRHLFKDLEPHPSDVVILAGDISTDVAILRETFSQFTSKFAHVFFCPGNHDLWIRGQGKWEDSMEKLRSLEALCEEVGVHTKPKDVGGGVLIVPMLSWYEPGFDEDPDVPDELTPVEHAMMDFHCCSWPGKLSGSDGSLASHFDALNGELPDTSGFKAVISFSHFLPRIELLPEKRYLFYPPLVKAVGSRPLRARIDKLKPHCHVFGHTHYGWSMDIDGVHYLQAAVAYGQERTSRGFSLSLRDNATTSSSSTANATSANKQQDQQTSPASILEGGLTSPVLVYDGKHGRFQRYVGFWSRYYSLHERRPSDTRWLYRPPRNSKLKSIVVLIKELADAGKELDDDVIEACLQKIGQ